MENEIMVSICCITYNQELFIREAIESFLMQKTNFKYEIIIRDDASTDNTAKIIKEYEKKYPDIVKPIYEKVNGKKNGVKKSFNVTFEKAIGKYIAICEGDDYWISEYKLQKQVDYMEKNPGCTFCFHNANVLFMKSKKIEKHIKSLKMPYKKFESKDGNYDCSNINLVGMGWVPTASFLFRTENAKEFPKWYFEAPMGDLPMKLYMTSLGYAHYIDEVLSVYRREYGNSISDNWKKNDIMFQKNLLNKTKNLFNNFDEYTDYKYKEGIEIYIDICNLKMIVLDGNYKKIIKDKKLRKYYKLTYRDRFGIRLFIKAYFSKLYALKK